MKANELMIGDWVGKLEKGGHTTPVKIIAIYDTNADYENRAGYTGCMSVKGYDPIPLTPKILKKNEWECVGEDESGPIMQIHDGPTAFWYTMKGGECGCERSVNKDGEEDIERVFTCHQICYVHELQHALKLCQIDKEIVL